jgi:hypothetical protein
MRQRTTWHRLFFFLLPPALIVVLFLLPPERTLGDVIKLVLLHGALVRAALIAFAVAGVLGVLCLVSREPVWSRWCAATQATALLFWVANMLSSSLATRLTWGEWIAWGEPRVWATLHIFWLAAACLILVHWLNHRIFTGAANLVVALLSWGLINGATVVRHPFDPLGTSNSLTYQITYGMMVFLLLLLGWQLAHRLVPRTFNFWKSPQEHKPAGISKN